MKIVDVAEFYAERGGGVRTYVDQKLMAAAELGHELVVIAPGPADREEARRGGRVLWVKSPPLPPDPRYHLFVCERAVHGLLAREAPDVIEGSSPWGGGWFVARYRGGARKSFVFHHDPVAVYLETLLGGHLGSEHVHQLCAGYWQYLRRLSRGFDMTLVSGHWLVDRLARRGIGNAVAVPFGVDKALFGAARPDPALRAELIARAGAPPSAKLLVTVSRHHPEKRLGTLFRALQLVAARQPIALVVYGDGPLARWSAWRARGLPIHLAGLTRDRGLLARSLASADALLHGSSAETFGLVVAEALCAGLPVIVPDAGGAGELAGSEYAQTYAAGDAEDCARAIERFLGRDALQLRAAAWRAGRERVGSQSEHFAGLFGVYARLVGQAAGTGTGTEGC